MTQEIKNLINSSKTVAIFFHVGPDGDAMGSALALKEGLEQLGKDVCVFSQDEIGERMWFLNIDVIQTHSNKTHFDLAFVLDCGEIKRIGTMESVFKKCENVINIDHHLINENFTKHQVVNVKACSTCEIMFEFLKELGINFTKSMKLALYTGLATDTGCFMYSLNEKMFEIVDFLVEGNEEIIEKINYSLFREKGFNEIKLTGSAINKLESLFNGRLAFTSITQKELNRLSVNIEYTPNIIFLLSGLKDFDVICVVCEEKPGVFRTSFRSNKVDVCAFAKMFGGGGHKFASGCKIYGTQNVVRKKIIENAKEFFECME